LKAAFEMLRGVLGAAGRAENLPYTILGCLASLSLVARLVLIFQ
jgi:hypothetical protein